MLDFNEIRPLPKLGDPLTTHFSTWCKHHFKLVFVKKYKHQNPRYRLRCPMCLQPEDHGRSGVQHQKAIACFGDVRVRNAIDYEFYCSLSDAEKSSALRHVWRRVRYEEYLSSDQWRAIRNQVMDNHGSQCAHCGGQAEHVHHLTYERLGNENLSDLIPLCAPCHQKEHGRGF